MPRLTTIDGMLQWLARLQARRTWLFLLVGAAIALASLPFVRDLRLNPDFTALLPRNKPSVRDLDEVRRRIPGQTTLTLALESKDSAALRAFAARLAPRLEALERTRPELHVKFVDWNVASYEQFVVEHRALYAKTGELEKIRDSLRDRLDYERAIRTPGGLWLDDVPEDPRATIARIEEQSSEARRKLDRYPGGFYVHPDGKLLAIFLRTDVSSSDIATSGRLMDTVKREFAACAPGPDLRLSFTGDLVMAKQEHDAIATELAVATLITIALVLLSIYALYRRVRAIALLGLGIVAPALLTFAFADLTVAFLNSSTAFLGSIVIGNGINPGIVWLARYFEERGNGHEPAAAALRTHVGVWKGTLSASLAAALAYGSLMAADFRGFRDFGIISCFGMVVCWIATFTLLPALALLSERIRPLQIGTGDASGSLYGRLAHRLASGAPRAVALGFGAAAVVSLGLVVVAVRREPLEYDFRNLKSVREDAAESESLNRRVHQIVGRAGAGNDILVLLGSHEQAVAVQQRLEHQRDAQRPPAFGAVRSIDDLLPSGQAQKVALLSEIRTLGLDARKHAKPEDRRAIDDHIPPANLRPLALADLPESAARRFEERDGTRGRILAVTAAPGASVWDGRELVRWTHALRSVTLPDGSRPPLAGRAPVFADMIEVVVDDGPKTVAISFGITALLVALAFRKLRHTLLVLGSLLVGVACMGGIMALVKMKLNFLNFVAFPITFGNGVDYAVNVMRRYADERRQGDTVAGAVRTAVGQTGGAVVLCSLTTVIGYISLLASANRALNSFGEAMAVSELTCLLAAVIGLPALLLAGSRSAAPTRCANSGVRSCA